MTDRTGHMDRETSVGGEKQGHIKSDKSRWGGERTVVTLLSCF